MKYHAQKYLHDPGNGLYGDCYRTVLACLLDLERDDVPHFMDGVDNFTSREDLKKVYAAVDDWLLANHGLRRFATPYPGETDLDLILATMGQVNPDARFMLSGTSLRGTNHVVICKGGKIEHDTSHTRLGITGPLYPYNFYVIEVLARAC